MLNHANNYKWVIVSRGKEIVSKGTMVLRRQWRRTEYSQLSLLQTPSRPRVSVLNSKSP